jgi:lipopolysaccharide transport system ATP-binding protein
MAAGPALRLESVWKRFRRGELHDSLRDLVPAMARRILGRAPKQRPDRDFWALKDVSFEVSRGEAFGVIGHNGAGKSTVLKHLSGLMRPTRGRVVVHGRLSALIEVGAGFHPDLTGRENVFLNGVILGMRKAEVQRKFDEIVAFSGLEEFIDTPVKRYSSGMFARLGFSVAAHLDPDILVIDEVLSVGDFVFQRKGLEKMKSIMESGATIIFVSHNLKAVAGLCQRALLLDHGTVAAIGPTSEVIHQYLDQGRRAPVGADRAVAITALRISDSKGEQVTFDAGAVIRVEVTLMANQPAQRVAVVLGVYDSNLNLAFSTATERLGRPPYDLAAGERMTCSFELSLHLAAGTFSLAAFLYRYDINEEIDRWFPGVTFFVQSHDDVRGIANLYPKVLSEIRHS